MTIHSASVWPHQILLPSALTACAVIAGPSLLGAAQAAPALTMMSAAIGLTTLVIGVALRQRNESVALAAPPRRRIRTLGWSP